MSGIFVAILVISPVAIVSDLSVLRYLKAIDAGEPVDEGKAAEIDGRQTVIGLGQAGLYLICAVAFLVWFHRAHKNLSAGGLRDLRYSPGWAVGGFFVPFLNLVRPYQVMKEVWAGAAMLSQEVDASAVKDVAPSSLVTCWWGLFLISGVLGRISGNMLLRADDLGELHTATIAQIASDLSDTAAALVAIWLVRRVTALQERARERLPTGLPSR